MLEYNLSAKNFPQVEVQYKSKKNKKTRIMIIGADHLLGWKVFEILKRDYAVIGIQQENRMIELEKVMFQDLQRLLAYITYQQIQTIIISSELLDNTEIKLKDIYLLLDFAYKSNIKVVYLYVHHILEGNSKDEVLCKIKYSDKLYLHNSIKLSEKISQVASNLVLNIDCCYGFSGSLKRMDFVNFIEDTKSNPVLLDTFPNTKIYPILADEIGLWLSSHIEDTGIIYFKEVNETSYKEWADICIQQQDISDYCSYEESGKFSTVSVGNMVEKHQENCIFNMVYKYSHHEYLKGNNVGKVRYELGRSLVKAIPEDIRDSIDCVSPVPQTGLFYAMGLATELSVPYIQAIDKTSSQIRSFQIKNTDIRKEILWEKLKIIPPLLKGKNVAVVDEAIFTGTTLKVVCEMLQECNVNKIYLCIPTPRCRYHCNYLVLPKRPMLLEYLNENMLTDYFDVEGVYFQDDKVFMDKIKIFGTVCADCFLGKGE